MAKPIYEVVNELPTGGLTVRALKALDWVVPGKWSNLTGFDETIKAITRETDEDLVQRVGERAIELYNDKSQGYRRALWLYQTVDSLQGLAGWVALTNKLGENFNFLSLLNKLTPKPDTTQAADLGVKLTVELLAFTQLNGLPGDSFADFVKSMSDYQDEALMRMAALVCFDGLIPLGPDFMSKAMGLFDKTGVTELQKSERFAKVRDEIPGGGVAEKAGFVRRGLEAVSDWTGRFVADRGLSVEKVAGNLKGFMDGIDGKLDYVAAFLDVATNYYEHTGTQSVARSLITRAASEV